MFQAPVLPCLGHYTKGNQALVQKKKTKNQTELSVDVQCKQNRSFAFPTLVPKLC